MGRQSAWIWAGIFFSKAIWERYDKDAWNFRFLGLSANGTARRGPAGGGGGEVDGGGQAEKAWCSDGSDSGLGIGPRTLDQAGEELGLDPCYSNHIRIPGGLDSTAQLSIFP